MQGSFRPARATEKTKMEESKMRVNLKRKIVALAAVALLGTGSVFASPPGPSPDPSAYCSSLLAEIRKETAELRPDAETLGTLARNPNSSWQNHAYYLDRVKGHINAVGKLIAELQQIRYAVLPWQQQAITKVTAHAAQVVASTQAAIVYLRENQNRLFVSEYKNHLTTIANRSRDMKQALDKFHDFEKTQEKFQQLQKELVLASN
jgi:hypothetical protein